MKETKGLIDATKEAQQKNCPHCHPPFKPIEISSDLEGCTLLTGAPYKKDMIFSFLFIKFHIASDGSLFKIVSADLADKLDRCPVCWRKLSN